MYKFATEVVEKLALMGAMEKIAVDTSSAQASLDAQVANVKAAHMFYEVLQKKAEATCTGNSADKFCSLVEKIAEHTGKSALTGDMQHKIAAAVLVDTTLTKELQKEANDKVATLRAYGREFITTLLQEALQ